MKVTHFDGGDDFVNDNGEILNLHRFCWRKWSAGEKGLRLMLEKMMSMIKIEILQNCLLFIDSSIEKKCEDNKTSSETAVNDMLKMGNQDV